MASKTMLHPANGSLGLPRASLGRQGSNIFSLTLEEFEMEHGKIGSMNMDEFLKNVWTAEESQAMVSAMTGDGDGNGNGNGSATAAGTSLQRQASLCSVPPTLVDKTVEEVWKAVQSQKQQQQQQQELSFGEMTLEDFLVRAGVVKEDMDAGGGDGNGNTMDDSQQQADWYSYQMKQQQQQMMQQQAEAAMYAKRSPVGSLMLPTGSGGGGGFYDSTYDGTPAGLALSPGMGTPDTPSSKKRNLDLVVEKTVERRQRRMIKNRESAARSRARKQAYTVELEAEVTQLKEENMRLKRWQAEEAERRRKQVMEVFLPVTQQEELDVGLLRRTRSGP